jgi:indolepyruvate decarboxylase
LPAVSGGGKGYLVKTEGEFNQALTDAWKDRSQMHIIQAKLAEGDASKALLRLAERLGARV